MAPFEKCEQAGHNRSRCSPNGITMIEECEICRLRWIMPSRFDRPEEQPITIYNSSVFTNQKENNNVC